MPVHPQTTPTGVGFQLILLSAASGCLDILGYQQLGQVFTSVMTGNVALLGLGLGQADVPAISRNLTAFASFIAGLMLAAAMLRKHPDKPGWSPAVTRTLVLEEVLLVGFAALWQLGAGPSSEGLLYGLIAVSAAAMGMQSAAAHDIGVPGITTTYFTGTLTRIVTGSVGRHRPAATSQKPGQQPIGWLVLALLGYLVGAALTGFFGTHASPVPAVARDLWIPALPGVAVALVLLIALLRRR